MSAGKGRGMALAELKRWVYWSPRWLQGVCHQGWEKGWHFGEEGWRYTFIVGFPEAQRAKMELVWVNKTCFWPLWLGSGPLYGVRGKV